MLKQLLNPDLFHGQGKRRHFFEGWYFKIVDANKKRTFAFIPGLFLGKTKEESHSFIQLLDGTDTAYKYKRFPTNDFSSTRDTFSVSIADNYFSFDRIELNIDDPDFKVKGTLGFKNVLKWPDTLVNPGSMGFYNYIPSLQCYSQVCAMDMDLIGKLKVKGEIIDFENGKGYIEKNWGKAFPYSWIWIQSNNFSHPKTSLSCSLAHIPFSFFSFRGFLIGLYVRGVFYSFTTMNQSRIHIAQNHSDIKIQVENARYVLHIQTITKQSDFVLLNGPRNGKMIPLVQENLQSKVEVTLLEKKHKKTIFQDEGFCAGIEFGGEQMLVLDKDNQQTIHIKNDG
jgi:tocopherol cyclase